jgi:integrase
VKSTAVAPLRPLAQPSKNGKLPGGRFAAGNRGRPTDAEQGRPRAYLTPTEVEALMKAARQTGRHGHRDRTLILMAYRHGLRVSELIALRWDQIDLTQGLLAVTRRKHGVNSTHPLGGAELRALRRLERDYGPAR